jgi:3-isopropylmalate/(R)-2-methylmalate dehydratase large subunit
LLIKFGDNCCRHEREICEIKLKGRFHKPITGGIIMGMTMTQKILADHAGLKKVTAGQLIESSLDMVLGNDVTAPVAIREMEKIKKKEVFDRDKIALVPDHFTPNKDIKSAEHCKCVREFAKKHDITNYFEIGEMGIEHALLPEKGLVVAGDVVIGADSHTCTYGALGAFSTGVGSTDMAAGMVTGKTWFKVPSAIKFVLTGKPSPWVSGKDIILHIIGKIGVDGALYKSMEFTGDGIANLSMDDRFTMANMAIEAGAKNGIFPVDEKTVEYMKEHSTKPYKIYEADPDAEYDETYVIDLASLKPTVAFPHLPENTKTIDEVDDIKIDQVVIGSCTNGRLSDLRVAARILKGRKVAKGLRVIIFPATQAIYLKALEEGLIETFIKAGAVVSTPTCGPCLGGHMGILAEGERAVATTNRNFVGRMGHVKSEVYLASPAVAAASAVTGKISGPADLGL